MLYRPPRSDPSTPLDQPYYGIGFFAGWKRYWQKYATFSGRASRSEFWWAFLGNAICFLILTGALYVPGAVIATQNGSQALVLTGSFVMLAFVLAAVVPAYAILWRRLHDANLAGPFALFALFPYAGTVWLIVIGCLTPKLEGARFDVH
ncbi:hypothetical protein GCM10022287_37600 [Gryllotalpicola koreensis]|uniref:DUF805 domain-containing protein n=2 Tax=Gryllotalpicola koreensis TaxID=993086 RepID=A0ABP8ACN6_9MICO